MYFEIADLDKYMYSNVQVFGFFRFQRPGHELIYFVVKSILVEMPYFK